MTKELQNSNADPAIEQQNLLDIAHKALKIAKDQGASAAEVGLSVETGLSTTVRLGEVDTIEFNKDRNVGVTVYFGQQRAHASTADITNDALVKTVQAACDIAQAIEGDPCFGLAERELLSMDYPELDLYHPWQLAPEQAISLARECEEYALAADAKIKNSEGASLSTQQGHYAYANSHDFAGSYSGSRHSLSCVLVAEDGHGMQRDYDYTAARNAHDLTDSKSLAHTAAARTLRRLSPQQVTTGQLPVIFTADIASSLFGSFIAANSGSNLYRKSSFLVDSLGQQIFPKFIEIYEQPHLPGALGSAPFDAEGIITRSNHFVEAGVLTNHVLGCYSARRLKLATTANSGGVHNLVVKGGDKSFEQLLKQMDRGIVVTELMGHGVNLVTGDYSRGACGFMVENGQIQYPVDEFTIAGNLSEMFMDIVAVGNDYDLRKNIRSGSVLIAKLMVAGV